MLHVYKDISNMAYHQFMIEIKGYNQWDKKKNGWHKLLFVPLQKLSTNYLSFVCVHNTHNLKKTIDKNCNSGKKKVHSNGSLIGREGVTWIFFPFPYLLERPGYLKKKVLPFGHFPESRIQKFWGIFFLAFFWRFSIEGGAGLNPFQKFWGSS